MNIQSYFLSSLISQPKLASGFRPEDFLGRIYHENKPLFEQMPYILSAGAIHATYPWSFYINGLDCYLLLYTTQGCGKLLVDNKVYTLDASSLLFFDCSQRFRLDIAVEPWDYQALFVKGELLSSYYNLLPDNAPGLISIASQSDLAMNINSLLSQKNSGECSRLIACDLLNHTLSDIVITIINQRDDSHPRPASYLEEMRELFDKKYQEFYSLDDLAEQYHVSKYRLCREFSSAFGYPPLQYLNRHRINTAAHLLLTTDLKIHEIGNQIGISNTNHFISLFKKYKNCTPSKYKQRMS